MLLGGAAFGAVAQYKIVAPDGSVTYTDKPPAASVVRPHTDAVSNSSANVSGLPYETRQASTRYPVTLYAAKACAACDSARQWLRAHAIPFNEYSLDNDADLVVLRQRFGDLTAPVITIGSQTLKGFSASDLQSYADAAGYPKQARLNGYNWPPAVPLAPVAISPTAPPSPPSPAAPPPPALPPPSKSGIQF